MERSDLPPLPSARELCGLHDTHVVALAAQCSHGAVRLHPAAAAAFAQLREDALGAGFDLRVVSGFRSFERQLSIWNAKATGRRAVLDEQEREVDISGLCERDKLFAILHWSALPGTSRHHWGSDVDVIDAAAMPQGYQLQLSVRETIAGGPFAGLHRWLGERIEQNLAHGFFRPYTGTGCAVAAEPWHLSYAPLAWRCQHGLDSAELARIQREAGMELMDAAQFHAEEIASRFLRVPAQLYPENCRAG